jgi:hypothetical protein
MKRRKGGFFSQSICAFTSLLLCTVGILAISLPLTGYIQFEAPFLILAGISFIFIGAFFGWPCFREGNSYFKFEKEKKMSVLISETVFQQYLDDYWKKRLPEYKVKTELILSKRNIRIFSHLVSLSKKEKKRVLDTAKTEIPILLYEKLGFESEIIFNNQSLHNFNLRYTDRDSKVDCR